MHTISPAQTEAPDCADALPLDFDPQEYPILARHWFGWRQPTKPSAEVVDLNLIRLAAALHRLGEVIGVEVGSRNYMLERVALRPGAARR